MSNLANFIGGGKRKIQIYDTAGSFTFTRPPGVSLVKYFMVGGGAGGQGARSGTTASKRVAIGSGGEGGQIREGLIEISSDLSINIGAGGPGGIAVTGSNPALFNGSDGGNTTLTGTGVNLTAQGGKADTITTLTQTDPTNIFYGIGSHGAGGMENAVSPIERSTLANNYNVRLPLASRGGIFASAKQIGYFLNNSILPYFVDSRPGRGKNGMGGGGYGGNTATSMTALPGIDGGGSGGYSSPSPVGTFGGSDATNFGGGGSGAVAFNGSATGVENLIDGGDGFRGYLLLEWDE